MSNITRTEFDLILRLGETEYRCSSHSSQFALNRIPLASCTLAVGRDVRNLKPAMVHLTADTFTVMQPAVVLLRPKGHWATWQGLDGDNPQFNEGLWTKAGEQVIFRGYMTGVGYQKQRGQLAVTVQLIHWLSDLAFSSIFSNQSHAENPSRFTFQATYPANLGPGTTDKKNFIGGTRYKEFIRVGDVKADLWKAIGNIFCAIAKDDDLIRLGSPARCGGVAAKNDQSLEALKRIEGGHECDDTDNFWHRPLGMAGLGVQAGSIADAIRRYIAQQSLNSWWATTMWDKLIHDFGPSFMFHVVPRVETAIIAPFVPGLRDSYSVSLEPEDVSRLNLSSHIRRPLRGVGVYGGREVRTVATDRKSGDITARMGIGGCFMPDPDAKGMILIKRAPSWLTNVPALGTKTSKTVMGKKAGGSPKPTSSATTPVPVSEDTGGGDDGKSGAEKAIETQDVYDRLAHYIYVQEVLRGRQGTLTGKFRYDVAPGTTLSFVTTGDPHIGLDQLRGRVYCSVMQVANRIDSEMGQAATTFALAHLRSSGENQSEKWSVDSHPLYEGNKFLGAPLVDEYLFNP